MEIIIVAAVSENNIIGNKGKLPWNIPEELSFFKELTSDYPVIMGKNTFTSLEKPLANRNNYVLSRTKEPFIAYNGYCIVNSFTNIYQLIKKDKFSKVFIIGGCEVYKEAMEDADKLIISRIEGNYDGDKFFPLIDKNIWLIESVEKRAKFKIEIYERKL
ncbi:MAG: dihydrofolate reductase [bacterium]